VRIACIAQLVNVIAPIMTEPGGPAWKQSTYFPYYFASVFGRGTALDLNVDCPGYDADVADNVPYLDVSGVHNEAAKTVTFFAVNRHPTESLELKLDLNGFGAARVIDHQVMTHSDLRAVNSLAQQNNVAPKAGSGMTVDSGTISGKLPPYSYQMIRVQLS
jgi:alpha-N-arabinofuranosidase